MELMNCDFCDQLHTTDSYSEMDDYLLYLFLMELDELDDEDNGPYEDFATERAENLRESLDSEIEYPFDQGGDSAFNLRNLG